MNCLFDGELSIERANGTEVLIDTQAISAVEEVRGRKSAVVLKNGKRYVCNYSIDTLKQKIEDSEDDRSFW